MKDLEKLLKDRKKDSKMIKDKNRKNKIITIIINKIDNSDINNVIINYR